MQYHVPKDSLRLHIAFDRVLISGYDLENGRKCLSSALTPLNLSWKSSGCTPATFFFEHSKLGKGSLCYTSIWLFSLSFMYNFILLLITKEFFQPKMIVMTFPGINTTNRVG